MSEFDTFRKFCRHVARQPGGLTARCPSASEARSLRKRFYRLRAQLPDDERAVADNLQAVVVGRFLTIKRQEDPKIDWTKLETTHDQPQDALPEGDRLNDPI